MFSASLLKIAEQRRAEGKEAGTMWGNKRRGHSAKERCSSL